VLGFLKSNKKLVEIGCGNGRDSVFFAREKNIDVLAIDQAEGEVNFLNNNFGRKNLRFVSDDFSDPYLDDQYDYIYSRFTMHSVSEIQEDNVLKWVKLKLNDTGLFLC
jgi:cyclopropane fatty-acyl-phospholipid synthase-like methyltransferase